MNDELDRIYAEALDMLAEGASMEAVLAHYPGQAADLRPFLLVAARLSTLATQPGLSAEQRSKRAFLVAAAAPRRAAPASRRLGWLTPLLALLTVILLAGVLLVGASASAVPGGGLYGAKRLVERVRLGLANDPERAALLRERLRQERVNEVTALLAAGQAADVTFSGTVEIIDGERWWVDGLPVAVTAATTVEGVGSVGALVEVTGRAADDEVRATRVVVLSGVLPAPTPSPAPDTTPTHEAYGNDAPAETETATPAPSSTHTRRPTASPSPTVTPTAGPGAAPPTPTPPAPPGDNGNDNDDDNDNAPPTDTPQPEPPTVTPPPPPDDNDNDNDDDNDNVPPTDTPQPEPPTVTPPPPPGDNDNDNDDNGNGNDNDDNSNDNDDNGNDNDDNDNDDNGNDNDVEPTVTPPPGP